MPGRRRLLQGLAVFSAGTGVPAAGAVEYAGAGEVLAAIDALESEVAARLQAITGANSKARAFTRSVAADRERHRTERARVRRRLRLSASVPARTVAIPDAADLSALRERQQAFVHAYAEGLPAIGDPDAVDTLARQMVDLARQLAVIDLWLEAGRDD